MQILEVFNFNYCMGAGQAVNDVQGARRVDDLKRRTRASVLKSPLTTVQGGLTTNTEDRT